MHPHRNNSQNTKEKKGITSQYIPNIKVQMCKLKYTCNQLIHGQKKNKHKLLQMHTHTHKSRLTIATAG